MVRPTGLEPVTFWFEARRSIQLNYGRISKHKYIIIKAGFIQVVFNKKYVSVFLKQVRMTKMYC